MQPSPPSKPRNNSRIRFVWRRTESLALFSGLLLPLAYAPFGLYPLAIVLLAVLFMLWRDATPALSAWRGFLFGFGMFLTGVSWVYVSLHNYGNMPMPMAAFAVLLFVAILALYPALAGWLQARLPAPGKTWRLLVLMPALWVLLEWLRSWLFSGFPWLHLGYSQVPGPLAGLAPWLGVYGTSYAVAMTAALVVWALWRRQRAWPAVPAVILLWLGAWLAGQLQWVQPLSTPLKVALVQSNVALQDKWVPEQRAAIMQRYLALSMQQRDADLIVWPEAAIPTYLQYIDEQYLAALRREASQFDTDFLIGVVEMVRQASGNKVYNSVVSIDRQQRMQVYRKHHLVPFGEFLPLKPALQWLLDYLHIPMSDFDAANGEPRPLEVAGHALGISICYEDAFGEELIQVLPQASVLVNVSEDAWFGRSLAPHQRVQMARLRAMESGRPMLRAANTGPSMAIDHRGRVLASSPQFRAHVLRIEIQPMTGMTPYARSGNWPVISLLLLLIVATPLWHRWRRRA